MVGACLNNASFSQKKIAFFFGSSTSVPQLLPQARTWNGPKQSCRVFVTSEQIQGWFGGDLWMAT